MIMINETAGDKTIVAVMQDVIVLDDGTLVATFRNLESGELYQSRYHLNNSCDNGKDENT